MTHDFASLDPEQFELFCGALLTAEGFRDVRHFGRRGDGGIDWIATAPDGTRLIAQVKRFSRPVTSPSVVGVGVVDLQNGLSLTKSDRAILMVSVPLPKTMAARLQKLAPGVEVWDAEFLGNLLEKHAALSSELHYLKTAQEGLANLIKPVARSEAPDERGAALISQLDSIPRGKPGWRAYEDTCIQILAFCFVPPLRLPRIQTTTDDGLDRRDAIFPIGTGNVFWDGVKHQHASRMVVAEFKNYADPIGQAEVESLQQYLLPSALRSFGLLCSRHAPSQSAIRARRRAWLIASNIILFLSDDDLKEMIRIRSDDDDPATLLDTKLDEFFIHLAP